MTNQSSVNLMKKREDLISGFLEGKETGFLKRHSRIYDDYFCESFEKSIIGPKMDIAKNPYAIVALGGYGRKEQCIFSDIDLLFLFKQSIPGEAEGLVKEIIYPLWDMGFEVGHATRTLKECINLAGDDFEVLMSLLDGRFICGMSHLHTDLMEQLRKKVIQSRSKKIISLVIENNRERHSRFGDSTYLLEPNLKEGQGGLRDYHTMLWIARIKSEIKEARDLEYYGYLSQGEFKSLWEALSFIWNVRNRLHHFAGRKGDQLHLEYQTRLADIMEFEGVDGQMRVESFLGQLHGQMEFIKQQHVMFLAELGYGKLINFKRRILGLKSQVKHIEVIKNMLSFSSMEAVVKEPELLIKIFEESARLKIPLSSEAQRVVKEFIHLVDDNFRGRKTIIKAFEKILVTTAQTFDVLNEMLITGFLEAFIPEYKRIVSRIQFDEYHLYPVDKHLLYTVQTIKGFGAGDPTEKEPLCSNLYKELSNKKVLLWAALLHDIGKGKEGKGHSRRGATIAEPILKRAGYSPKKVETVSFLISEHLFLMKIATRRDINDEETAIFCARRIKDTERLKMLYLLSVADSMSTGPKAWNDWTSTLLRDLFLKTLKILKKGELATSEVVESIERKKNEVLAFTDTPENKELNSILKIMSPRYFLYVPVKDILEHINLYTRLKYSSFIWNITKDKSADTRTVTICAPNRPGLFSKIAGVFTLSNINILDAQIYTWRNNIALDIFQVTPPPDQLFEDERWAKVEKKLKRALEQELNLPAILKDKMEESRSIKRHTIGRPNQVKIDNSSSSFFTIVDVIAYDFPGLLFSITDALFRCGLDIQIAKIATKVDQVVDVFYVRDLYGEKVDSEEQVEEITAAIEKVLIKGLTQK